MFFFSRGPPRRCRGVSPPPRRQTEFILIVQTENQQKKKSQKTLKKPHRGSLNSTVSTRSQPNHNRYFEKVQQSSKLNKLEDVQVYKTVLPFVYFSTPPCDLGCAPTGVCQAAAALSSETHSTPPSSSLMTRRWFWR